MARSILVGERVRIHPASDWFMRGVTHGVVTSKRIIGAANGGVVVLHYVRPNTIGIATPAKLRMKLRREDLIVEGDE